MQRPDPLDLPDDEPRPGKPSLGWPPLTVATVSCLLGFGFVPFTVLAGLGTASSYGAQTMDEFGLIGLLCLVATGLLVGALGLLVRLQAGWWTSLFSYAFFFVFNAKLLAPITMLDWDHARAREAALSFVLREGTLLLASAAMIVLLMLPSVRRLYGMGSSKYVRRRKAGRLRSSG
jgi:hypothetical protein